MIKGVSYLIFAEFFFALSTVFAKLITKNSDIPAVEIMFLRFFLGFFFVMFLVQRNKISLRPQKFKFVVLRAVLNTSAALLFFISVEHTTVTNANMLNMTYPVFIFLFLPFIQNEKIRKIYYLFLAITMLGIYLIIQPHFDNINIGDVIGLGSGIIAAFSVISLSMARNYDSTLLILFYLMFLGGIMNFFIMLPVYVSPPWEMIPYMVGSALSGVLGQALITSGYKYISARTGSIVSSSRMIFATGMGFIIFSDNLNFTIIVGGILILCSCVGTGYFMKQKQ